MDSHTHSVQRLEIVDTGRRRRWTDDEKRRIIEESCDAPRQISATARRHGIAASQLFAWRRALATGPLVSTSVTPPFVPVRVEPEPAGVTAMQMEIVSARGTRIFVDARLDKAALAASVPHPTVGSASCNRWRGYPGIWSNRAINRFIRRSVTPIKLAASAIVKRSPCFAPLKSRLT